MGNCIDCRHYVIGMQLCRRFPQTALKTPADTCGEYSEPKKPVPMSARIKLDGTPCTAPALAGRDVCLGHSDKKRNK